jgi:hypothetical protein
LTSVGFRLYWLRKSRPRGDRSSISPEVRALTRRLAQENAGCGAPKIHGELRKVGFVLSERTGARYLTITNSPSIARKPHSRRFAVSKSRSLAATSTARRSGTEKHPVCFAIANSGPRRRSQEVACISSQPS